MFTRREFLKTTGTVILLPHMSVAYDGSEGVWVNDIHAQVNRTLVTRVLEVASPEAVQEAINTAESEGKQLSIAGGRHSMGAQQFGTDTILIDTRKLNKVIGFDRERGIVEVQAGVQWPKLISYLVNAQKKQSNQWGIAQKQTGADRLTLGGALAANIHGRGLTMRPFVSDVESFTMVDANGRLRECSRHQNKELFRLVAGGYGLFGFVTSIKLRLVTRRKLRRVVKTTHANDLMDVFDKRVSEGFLYGDFQFNIDDQSEEFLLGGILSCYIPVDPSIPIPPHKKILSSRDWETLVRLAHTDKQKAFEKYIDHYLASSGQVYWSDTHQLSPYLDHYHRALDRESQSQNKATEIITEIYVPRPKLIAFLNEVRDDFRKHGTNLIYGTIRLIERDNESFLAWARERYACIIFNLHTVHTPKELNRSASAFLRLIDMAINHGGSYFLTYHKFATRQQVLSCYPQFPEFLNLKKRYDPEERFQSDWYRHYRNMFQTN